MNKYLIVYEKTKTGYAVYSPDLPGCIATGPTRIETTNLMKEAMEFHIEGMIEDGLEIPEPTTRSADFVTIKFKKSKSKELAIV